MQKNNTANNKKRSAVFVLLETVFLIVICFPNFSCLYSFVPYLSNADKLQSELLSKSGLFIDVAKYYACAQIASQLPGDIWNLNAQQNWFKNYLKIEPTAGLSADLYTSGKLSPAQYTPQSIVMFMPLTRLPLHQAIAVWEILSLLFMLIPISILMYKCFQFSFWQSFVWWLIVLAAAPATENFCYGQLNGFLSGLAAIFLLSWQSKHVLLAALSLALSLALKPHQALVMLIMSLAARKFRLLLLTIIISLLLIAGTISVLGIEPVLKYPSALLSIELTIDKNLLLAPTTLIVSILGPISIFFGRQVARLISLPALLICLSVIYIIWRKAVLAGKETYFHAYASSLLLFLILGPHEHFYDLLLLSTAWACTVPAIEIEKIYALTPRSLRLWSYLFVLFPLITWTIYFCGSGSPDACFGAWHLPLLVLMFVLSLFNFREVSKRKANSILTN